MRTATKKHLLPSILSSHFIEKPDLTQMKKKSAAQFKTFIEKKIFLLKRSHPINNQVLSTKNKSYFPMCFRTANYKFAGL